MKKSILFALYLSIFSLSLFAEDIDLNPIVVISNRQEQRLSDVMTSVSVITRQDIERLQPHDIGSILQGQPGPGPAVLVKCYQYRVVANAQYLVLLLR